MLFSKSTWPVLSRLSNHAFVPHENTFVVHFYALLLTMGTIDAQQWIKENIPDFFFMKCLLQGK